MNRSVNEISGSHRRIRRITEMSEREYISFKKRRAAALNIKNNMIKLAFILAAAVVLAISIKAVTTIASSSSGAEQKYYKTISIGYADTLESIADANYDPAHYSTVNDYLKEISDINHISADSAISGGQIIYIPYYGEVH